MILRPRYKWFCNTDKDACDNWYGPHKSIEAALNECQDLELPDLSRSLYVAQGHKLTKDELSGMEDVDFTWEVDTREILEIKYLKDDMSSEGRAKALIETVKNKEELRKLAGELLEIANDLYPEKTQFYKYQEMHDRYVNARETISKAKRVLGEDSYRNSDKGEK